MSFLFRSSLDLMELDSVILSISFILDSTEMFRPWGTKKVRLKQMGQSCLEDSSSDHSLLVKF